MLILEKTESESTKYNYVETSWRVEKEDKDFDHFCVVLENEGYHVWSEKLREATGICKRQQLSCITYADCVPLLSLALIFIKLQLFWITVLE